MATFRVSRELLHLTIEQAAAEAAKRFVEGAFAIQFPGEGLDLSTADFNFQMIDLSNVDLCIEGFDVEVVD